MSAWFPVLCFAPLEYCLACFPGGLSLLPAHYKKTGTSPSLTASIYVASLPLPMRCSHLCLVSLREPRCAQRYRRWLSPLSSLLLIVCWSQPSGDVTSS